MPVTNIFTPARNISSSARNIFMPATNMIPSLWISQRHFPAAAPPSFPDRQKFLDVSRFFPEHHCSRSPESLGFLMLGFFIQVTERVSSSQKLFHNMNLAPGENAARYVMHCGTFEDTTQNVLELQQNFFS